MPGFFHLGAGCDFHPDCLPSQPPCPPKRPRPTELQAGNSSSQLSPTIKVIHLYQLSSTPVNLPFTATEDPNIWEAHLVELNHDVRKSKTEVLKLPAYLAGFLDFKLGEVLKLLVYFQKDRTQNRIDATMVGLHNHHVEVIKRVANLLRRTDTDEKILRECMGGCLIREVAGRGCTLCEQLAYERDAAVNMVDPYTDAKYGESRGQEVFCQFSLTSF